MLLILSDRIAYIRLEPMLFGSFPGAAKQSVALVDAKVDSEPFLNQKTHNKTDRVINS